MAMHSRSTLHAWGSLLLLLSMFFMVGCDRGGGTVRRGSLSYNATEVFGEGSLALALAKAAGRGDKEEIDRLIAAGADVNAVGKHGMTPLWWAAWKEDYRGFERLLEKGADPNAQRTEGLPIMHAVTYVRDSRFLATALKHGGDPNQWDLKSDESPLFPAVRHNYKAQIDLLLAPKADLNAQAGDSRRTLPMAAIGARRDYELAYRLLQLGSNPHLTNANGGTLFDAIATASRNASNNDDPYRAKVLELLAKEGITANTNQIAPAFRGK
jgi:ankyrin repeat protein